MNHDVTYIMVLNDGETYSQLEGCHIVAIPQAIINEADDVVSAVEEYLDGLTDEVVKVFGATP